ncbi:MAG: hypothetical protein JO001_04280 [Alphaproteobacteria bacterium]|nr:hypothetical protein [Alphaproteobacteria bacterium]
MSDQDDVEIGYFFTASSTKLVIMSLFTLGWYVLYWFYQNWHFISLRSSRSISPLWRTVFNIFWIYPLFSQIATEAKACGIAVRRGLLQFLAALLILDEIAVSIGRASREEDAAATIAFIAFSMIGIAIVAIANRVALNVNLRRVHNYSYNMKFTRVNVGWIGFVVLILVSGTVLIALDNGHRGGATAPSSYRNIRQP